MTVDRKIITSLGFCEPIQSDFDDVREVLVVKGNASKVKVGELGKAKLIRPVSTVISADGQNHVIPGRMSEPVKLSQLSSFISVELQRKVKVALNADRQRRKNNLQHTEVVK